MFLLLIFLGIFSGYFAGFLGIGAGVFLMPVFILMKIYYPVAVNASLMAVFLSSVTTSIQNRKILKEHIEPIFFMAIPAAITALIGNLYLIKIIPTYVLMLVFSGLMLLNVDLLRYLSKKKQKQKKPRKKKYIKSYVFAGAISGLTASLLGVGGGIIIVTILCFFAKFTSKTAVKLSIVTMIFTTFFSLLSESMQYTLPFGIGIPTALGAVIGGYFGGLTIRYVDSNTILRVNYVISFLLGIMMIYNVIRI